MTGDDRRDAAILRVVAIWDNWRTACEGLAFDSTFSALMSTAVDELAAFAPPIQRPADRVLDEAAPWVKDEEAT